MRERLALALECYGAGDTTSELSTIGSWVQMVCEGFDLMPTDGEEAAASIARRMAAVPRAYRQLSATLLDAARSGRCAARRQVEEVEEVGARAGPEKDACGPEIYTRASRHFLGAAVDLQEAYAWSWEEIARLRAEMARVSNLIRLGATAQEAMAILGQDPARRVEGRENFRAWMQELADRTISELHGTHFDIPQPAHRIEAAIAPTNDGGIYYTGPSEDWSRPGRMWWSVPDGVEAFSTWKEVTVVYHEGVPGHHLQISHAMANGESLNRWQRMSWVSGHGEGWALYAERLMGELGYLDDPGAYLGMLDSQQLLAAQVPLDAASACRVRPLPTRLVNGSGCRPGPMPWPEPERPSASRTFTPRRSAWALWVLTRSARRLPASKDAQQRSDGQGQRSAFSLGLAGHSCYAHREMFS
jgi:uncharacterized protein (DUF885 family)